MAGNRITLGNRYLRRAVREYAEDFESQVKRIVTETATIIHSNAKALAPVDDGNLRDSIEMEILQDGLLAIVRVTAHYAIYVEYGTGIYASKGNGRQTPWTYYSDKLNRFVTTEGQRPQEFWAPAIDAGGRFFRDEMRKMGL